MHIGKGNISYRRIDDPLQDRSQAIAVKKLAFAHKFSSAGLTDVDLTALSAPTTELPSWVNPSPSALAGANLYIMPENIRLVSSTRGELSPLKYSVTSNTIIRLNPGHESTAGEIIFGWVESTNTSGIIAVDGKSICQTGTLPAGELEILIGDPFTYNKYSSQQVGDVLLFIDGVLQSRCAGNSPSGEGNYYEIQPSIGQLSNILKLKVPFGSNVGYMVVSNGLVAERPTAAVLTKFDSIAGTIEKIVEDLSALTANPASKYLNQPTNVDLSIFGSRVSAYIRGVMYDAVVGSSAQLIAGHVTHTSIAAAIASNPRGKILILAGTYTETISLTSANNDLVLEGKGRRTQINGALNAGSSVTGLNIKNIRWGGNISIGLGCDSNFVRECWQAPGFNLTNSGSANSVLVIQE